MEEETLDPNNWEELRQLGHQMLDDMLDWQQTVRERPAWQPLPDEVKAQFQQSLPLEAQNIKEVYKDFLNNVLPFPNGNQHPRFWGWVHGTGSPFGMLAEMLAAGMNPNAGFGEQSAVYVEKQVIDWCKEMLGFPPDASGILVSGCTMANLTGLTVARNTKAGFDVQRQGLQNTSAKLALYGSSETHSSIQKAIEVLGLGSESLRRIPVNPDFQIDLAALKRAIAEDKAKGLKPFCIIGNAGTVNTGATDNLNDLADVCETEGLWLHIDGAFGALAALSPQYRRIVKGMERADSLAFDLHKWMSVPYEAGLCTDSSQGQTSPVFLFFRFLSFAADTGCGKRHLVQRVWRSAFPWVSCLKSLAVDQRKWHKQIPPSDRAEYIASRLSGLVNQSVTRP